VLRGRRKRDRAKRVAWLAEFDPGVRAAFFDNVDMNQAIFARGAARHMACSEEAAEKLLAGIAARNEWLTLRTRSGRVVGIGPRKR